jgi:hypothetical protein
VSFLFLTWLAVHQRFTCALELQLAGTFTAMNHQVSYSAVEWRDKEQNTATLTDACCPRAWAQNVSTVAPAASATAAASLASAQARSSSELPAGSASAAAAAEPQPGSSKKKKTSGKKKPKAQGKPAKKSTIVEVIKKRKKNGAVQWKARYSDGVEVRTRATVTAQPVGAS